MAGELGSHLFKQNTDLAIIELFIPLLNERTFLDIGAEKGEFTRFFAERGLKGVFFEPLPQCETVLTQLAAQTGCQFSSYAIDSIDRIADFYHAFDKTNNDAQHFSSLHPLQNDDRITHKKVTTVQCRSLDSLLKDGSIPGNIGVVKVDTEGNDLNVLKGMQQIKPEVLMCEFFMPKIYAGWEAGHPIGLIKQAQTLGFKNFIAIKRFDEFEFISLNNFEFINHQWGNLVFISDVLYEKTATKIKDYIIEKNDYLVTELLKNIINIKISGKSLSSIFDENTKEINLLRNILEERLAEITSLKTECDTRVALIDKISHELDHIPGLFKKMTKALKLFKKS